MYLHLHTFAYIFTHTQDSTLPTRTLAISWWIETHRHTQTHSYVHVHTFTYICIHIYAYTGFYSADPHPGNILVDRDTQTHSYVHVHTFTYICIHIYAYTGFYSADPHPGNILVDRHTKKAVLLDFGLVKELDLATRYHFAKLLVAAAEQGGCDS